MRHLLLGAALAGSIVSSVALFPDFEPEPGLLDTLATAVEDASTLAPEGLEHPSLHQPPALLDWLR
jgi:hypothetical protein